jgi:hypothetical protein
MIMAAISFNSVLIIAVISVLVPAVLGLLPRLPVPGAVLEVIAGRPARVAGDLLVAAGLDRACRGPGPPPAPP